MSGSWYDSVTKMLQEASRPIRHAVASQSSDSVLWNFVGLSFFFGAKYFTTSFCHPIFYYQFLSSYISTQEPRFGSLFGMSVLLVMQVFLYKTDVTNYMCNFPFCISTKYCQKRNGVSPRKNKTKSDFLFLPSPQH